MLLSFPDGTSFATGVVGYNSNPANGGLSRVIVEVKLEAQHAIQTTAIVDTAAPYMVCQRELANVLGLEHEPASATDVINIRGLPVDGSLHRVPLSLLAEEGEDLTIEASIFVPMDVDLPHSFLGLTSCLESIHFAIDPFNEKFYFGPYF